MGDTIFIFCLALIIFGPKKLPEIGRQIGKLMVEFRRASNEFKIQIEEELRASEDAERQKEITAAAALPGSSSLPDFPSSEAASTSTPVIAPPATGLPVNHTFALHESDVGESIASAAGGDAYPEPVNGFNPGLNTAANSDAASEIAATSTGDVSLPVTVFRTERFEPAEPLLAEAGAIAEEPPAIAEDPEIQKVQAPVHHG